MFPAKVPHHDALLRHFRFVMGGRNETTVPLTDESNSPFSYHRILGRWEIYGGKVITYSGDTEWTESLVDAARGADFFVCEAYFSEKKIKYHLDYQTLRENRQRLDCRRIVLTHMSADMLSRRSEVDVECADDGQVIVL